MTISTIPGGFPDAGLYGRPTPPPLMDELIILVAMIVIGILLLMFTML